MRNVNAYLGVWALVIGGAACDPLPAWEQTSDYPLTLGTGWDEYETYDELGELPMMRGFQGGQHFNVSLRATDIDAGVEHTCIMWAVDPDAADEHTALIEPVTEPCEFVTADEVFYGSQPDDLDPDMVFLPYLRLVVESPSDVLDRTVELRVQIESGDGRVGRAWAQQPVVWGPDPEDYDDEGEPEPAAL